MRSDSVISRLKSRSGSGSCLAQIPKLGNRPRPRRRARSRFIGYCAEKRADLPGNYFVPFVRR